MQSAQNASVGHRVWVFPALQTRDMGGDVFFVMDHLSSFCLRAKSTTAPLLMKLREVLFLLGLSNP